MSYKEYPGTYIIHNPETDQMYVGSTKNLSLRQREHMRTLKLGEHHNRKLQAAYNKNPNFEIIPVITDSREEAFNFEQEIINEFMGNPLFLNISSDARSCDIKITDEIRENMSLARKGKKQTPEHVEKRISPLRGRKLPPDVIKKMSDIRKGIPPPVAVLEAAIKANTGKHLSDEHKEKIRNKKIGVKMSADAIEANRRGQIERFKNNPVSLETRQKMTQTRTGSKHSNETKQRMKDAWIIRKQRNNTEKDI